MQIRISDADQNLPVQNWILINRTESANTEQNLPVQSPNLPIQSRITIQGGSRLIIFVCLLKAQFTPTCPHRPPPPPSKIPIWLHPHYPPPPLPQEHLPISPHYTLQRKQCGVPRQGEEGMGSGVKWGEECEELTPAHDTTTKHYHLTWYGVKQLVLIIQHLSQVLFVTLSL